jgi:hypothetical protein
MYIVEMLLYNLLEESKKYSQLNYGTIYSSTSISVITESFR